MDRAPCTFLRRLEKAFNDSTGTLATAGGARSGLKAQVQTPIEPDLPGVDRRGRGEHGPASALWVTDGIPISEQSASHGSHATA